MWLSRNQCFAFKRVEDFLIPELQATEEEKNKLESGLTNGDEPMDQDLSVVPTKCISSVENLEIKSVNFSIMLFVCRMHQSFILVTVSRCCCIRINCT